MADLLLSDSPRPLASPASNVRSARATLLLILGLALVLFLIRFSGPKTWADGYHQERAVAYVMDVLFNGNWICQTGMYEDITSKPPLFTWLIAVASLAFGPGDFSLMLPSALATTGLALLIFLAGRNYFNLQAGLFGAVMFLLSSAGAKQMALIRIDVLFSFTITLTALCAFASWQKGGRWVWFWLAAAAATLAKGPLGVALGAVGLLAVVWEKRTHKPVRLAGGHWWGVLLFLVLCGGWFAAAYAQMGKPLINVMLGRELLGHVVQDQGSVPFSKFYSPILYVCRSFIPWVVFSFIGLWRIIKYPAAHETERRFERFVFCWFTGGLFLFSAAAHQRPDLIFPLVAPCALLAGREASRLWGSRPLRESAAWGFGIAVLGLGLIIGKYHFLDRKKEAASRYRAVRQLARQVQALGGGHFPLSYVEGPVSLQFLLGTKRPLISPSEAAELLRSPAAAFVVVEDLSALKRELEINPPATYELAAWHAKREGFTLVGNRPALAWADDMVCVIEPVRLEMQKVRELEVHGNKFELSDGPDEGTVVLSPSGTNALPQIEVAGGGRPGAGTMSGLSQSISMPVGEKLEFRLLPSSRRQ